MSNLSKPAFLCLGALLAVAPTQAQEVAAPVAPAPAPVAAPAANPVQDLIDGYINGVTNIKRDQTGAIKSVVVVARTDIPGGLPSAMAERQASRSAQVRAQAAFREWLNSEVAMAYNEKNELTIYTEGSAEGETGAANAQIKSSGKTVTKEEFAMRVEGFVRGLQTIGSGVNDRNQFVAVYGWNAATTRALDGVEALMRPANARQQGRLGQQGPLLDSQRQQEQQGNLRPVQRGSSITDDAADFF